MRTVYAITSSLLLGGAVASLAMQPPANAQTAQNEPGAFEATTPRAGAPMSFADMVAKLQPAVVNVSTTQTVKVDSNPFAGTPFGQLFGGQSGSGGPPVTREAQALGSGFIISPDGYVVTNNHVVAAGAKGASVDEITVILSDRREFKARVIGKDAASDLALLKIDATGLPFVKWGDSTHSRVGDWVIAIGNPFGLGGTVTAGIISALHRVTGQGGAYDRFIQTDAAINKGNSGGPMFDMAGNVIGINSQILTPGEGSVGIGFAIPAELAKPIIDTFRSGGKITRGYLGVGIQPVSDDIAAALGLPKNRGEIISRLEPGQAAERAGVRQGDVVVSVNGQEVTPDNTLSYLVGNLKPGSAVRLGILRDNKPVTVTATVGTRPPEEQLATQDFNDDDDNSGDDNQSGQATPANAVGISVTALTPAIARSIGVDPAATHGVVVTAVDPSSDAGNKGLQRGDVISSVNRVPVMSAQAFGAAIQQARAAGRQDVLLFVTRPRGGNSIYVGVKLKR